MRLNMNWNREGMDRLADHIRTDGELAETPALVLLDMIAALRLRAETAEKDAAEAYAKGLLEAVGIATLHATPYDLIGYELKPRGEVAEEIAAAILAALPIKERP